MKNTHTDLSARYLATLRGHLDVQSAQTNQRAQSLGRSAVAAGLATLELAQIHEQAVLALAASHDFTSPGNGSLKRAVAFFTEALIPLESVQRATRETNQHLRERNETLRRHAAALARSNRALEREIKRREAGEAKLVQARERYRQLLLESQVMQHKLRHLTRQMLSAQEDERKKISRELHDEVVQALVGINVALSALGKDAAVGARTLRRKIVSTQRLIEHSVSAVHRFARELRPAVLDDLGLIAALHAYSKTLADRAGIRIQITAFGGVEALGIAKRTVLFRVAQEALNNVARHAEATHVALSLSERAGALQMEISDDGKSFPVAQTLLAKNNKRLGLIGMKERVEMVGGRFTIDSAPGAGTTIRAILPFKSVSQKS